jgi:hypothetical protein
MSRKCRKAETMQHDMHGNGSSFRLAEEISSDLVLLCLIDDTLQAEE